VKFKSIFILFNITLLLFLTILVLLPLAMIGSSFAESFWRINWPLIVVLTILFGAFNIYYFINRRLFLLLEKEDWPALVHYLEDRVIQQGQYNSRLVRLLANSYLVLSDSQGVMSLENKTAISRPALVDANVLVFGTARILGKDISGAVRFFETRKNAVKPALRDWAHWYHAFALLLNRQYEPAGDEFSRLARNSRDGVIAGLSSYFLSETIRSALSDTGEYREAARAGRERVLKALPRPKSWNQEISKLCTEIHAAALARYMEETGRWLYGSAG
jgi:hypothetical protein